MEGAMWRERLSRRMEERERRRRAREEDLVRRRRSAGSSEGDEASMDEEEADRRAQEDDEEVRGLRRLTVSRLPSLNLSLWSCSLLVVIADLAVSPYRSSGG
jgi:hypothetical protein